jgi:glycosyltransferase involved in cell wall biosynthesis
MPEVLGDAALLVPPEDTPALSQAMLHLLTDQGLAAEYRRRGMARAALYRWDDIARRTIRTYEEVL